MSYCVHCGVELADSEKECPLCGTLVYDPRRTTPCEPMFALSDIPIGKHLNRPFLIWIIFLILLIPFIVMSLISFIFRLRLTWSLYVLGGELCVGAYFLFPFRFPNLHSYGYCWIDVAFTSLYLAIIAWTLRPAGWYLRLALPITLIAGLVVSWMIFIIKLKRFGKINRFGLLFYPLAAFTVGIDIFINCYLNGTYMMTWSWYSMIPLVVLGTVFIAISRSVTICEWLRRKLFI